MKIKIMNRRNRKWHEFLNRLEGPEGCDFKEDKTGQITWKCTGKTDRPYAHAILKDMGFSEQEIADSMEWYEIGGGYCDCEILFNCT